MKTEIVFQGDIAFVRIAEIPADAVEQPATNGKHIVAHSETGHHHTVDSLGVKHFTAPKDPNICYLYVETGVDVIHERPWDTHAPRHLTRGCYLGIRQVERAPEGWRRVAD